MKVGVVGTGQVGATAAYTIAVTGVADEVALVDRDEGLAQAQAMDIAHALPFHSTTRVIAGGYDVLAGADVVILAAGVGQAPGETRLQLLARNAEVFRAVIGETLRAAPDSILIIASNPVDIMTDIAQRLSGLPPERVIGSGTILDTARFRTLVGRHLGISPQSVHGYVLGEHGDSEVLAWSNARAGSVPLATFAAQVGSAITEDVRAQIDDQVRNAAYQIINGKGATWFGIGGGLARIVKAIARDQSAVLSVSIRTPEIAGVSGATLSLPRVVRRSGVSATLHPDLDATETAALASSAQMLADLAASVQI